jgi:hypothetical protein
MTVVLRILFFVVHLRLLFCWPFFRIHGHRYYIRSELSRGERRFKAHAGSMFKVQCSTYYSEVSCSNRSKGSNSSNRSQMRARRRYLRSSYVSRCMKG